MTTTTIPKSCFSTCKLTLCTTVVRLIFIFELIPDEISLLLDLPSVKSITVRYCSTLRYLQVASSFRDLFPSLSQAYIASSSPPSILVWISYQTLDKWWSPLPEYWRRILWRLALLLVDYSIARILERIAISSLTMEKETNEEELQSKMPDVIQPPRAHVFEIESSLSSSKKDDTPPPLLSTTEIPILAASLYYGSPVTILSSGTYDSFQSVPYLLTFWSVYRLIFSRSDKQQKTVFAAVSLAIATYLQPWNMVFVIPICVSQPSFKSASVFAGLFCLTLVWLHLLSFLLVGTEAYFMYKPIQQLTPNLGPRWYFQMQLFDRFHDYFALLFTGLPYLVVIPLTIRLYRYPILLVTCLVFMGTLFHDNPALYDFNVALSLLCMSPRSMARMNIISLIAICSIAVPLLLYILDYSLWLETGSGNANYIFFQCLAYNAFVAIIFLDFVGASLQRDKALRMTAKLQIEG